MNSNGHLVRQPIKRLVASIAVVASAGGLFGALSVADSSAAQASTVAGITMASSARWTTCEHRVYVNAMSNEALDGNFAVYFRAAVYDYASRQWVWSGWHLADGITSVFTSVSNPFHYAFVQYAKYDRGWKYAAEWTPISDQLDNGFCS